MMNKVGVIGHGAWSTALVHVFDINTNIEKVEWYVSNDEIRKSIEDNRNNCKYLPHIHFSSKVVTKSDLVGVISNNDYIIFAQPSQYLKDTLDKIDSILFKDKTIIIASKGFIDNKGTLISEYLCKKKEIDRSNIFMISGPSFADEVGYDKITGLTLSAFPEGLCRCPNKLFEVDNIRLFTIEDIENNQLLGALKNIYAIGAGIINTSYSNSSNTRALYICRCLSEMVNILIPDIYFIKHKEYTRTDITNPACIGDLLMTCTSKQSRNYRYGELLGRNESHLIRDVFGDQVIEGLSALEAVHNLFKENRYKLPPIVDAIYKIYKGEKTLESFLKVI